MKRMEDDSAGAAGPDQVRDSKAKQRRSAFPTFRRILRPTTLLVGALSLALILLVLPVGYRLIMVPRLEATIRSWEENVVEFSTPRLAEEDEGPITEMVRESRNSKQHYDVEAYWTEHCLYRWAVQFIPIEDRKRVEERHKKLRHFRSLARERAQAEVVSRPWADHRPVDED